VSAVVRRIGSRLWLAREGMWDTSSLLAVRDGAALVCGPGFDHAMLTAAAREAGLDPVRVFLLVTHVDFDHLRGPGRLPAAEVIAGEDTRAALGNGLLEEYGRAAEEWGASWEAPPRIDRPVRAGETFSAGPFRVEAVPAPGHTPDAVAYVLPEEGVFLPGDYMSCATYPLVTGSLAAARKTYERLLAVLERNDVWLVVPGHGPVLDPVEAGRVAAEDASYLERLAGAAARAAADGGPPGPALAAVYGVEPPRSPRGGFEALDMRTANARAALEECR
jgi:hydroxyacylglutathione hydrolase